MGAGEGKPPTKPLVAPPPGEGPGEKSNTTGKGQISQEGNLGERSNTTGKGAAPPPEEEGTEVQAEPGTGRVATEQEGGCGGDREGG